MANIMDPDIMDTIFDMQDYEEEDDDFPPLPPPLPPLSPAREDGEDDAQGDATANGEDVDDIGGKMLAAMEDVPMAGRKSRRKPQPKLDAKRLCGERGIPSLPKHFDKVKFAGKGHEEEDLKLLMRTMEHWAHRLFPQHTFDDVIEKVEKLGQKKPVQVCMEKLRLGMPLLDEDFVRRGDDEDRDDGAADAGAGAAADAAAGASSDTDSGPQPPSQPEPSQSTSLTAEQREKMEQNRRLAEERRKARLQAAQQGQGDAVPGPSSAPDHDSSAMDTCLGSEDDGEKEPDDLHRDKQKPTDNREKDVIDTVPTEPEVASGEANLHISHNAPAASAAEEPEVSNEEQVSGSGDSVKDQSAPSCDSQIQNNAASGEPQQSREKDQICSDDEEL